MIPFGGCSTAPANAEHGLVRRTADWLQPGPIHVCFWPLLSFFAVRQLAATVLDRKRSSDRLLQRVVHMREIAA